MAQVIKRLHTLHRVGKPDVLFGILTRDGDTDALYQWFGAPPAWVFVRALEGTDLIYDTVTWQEKVHIADGKHPIIRFDETFDCFETAPVVQYLVVFQDRLFGAGDARIIPDEVAEVDSNRNMVRFCEVIDFYSWLPNNFITADTGLGEAISGLGVNSITSSTRGAQGQLVVFKPHSTYINDGTINANDQRLNIVSGVVGCPGYNSIKNTTIGLMFCSADNVCLMTFNAKEPEKLGPMISPAIVANALPSNTAAFFHEDTYKLSIAVEGGTTNTKEWWLDLRQGVYPENVLWYGPHSGDKIFQYEYFNDQLIGAEHGTTNIWALDVEGQWDSMASSSARTSRMIWGRIAAPNMQRGFIDAYGFKGTIERSGSGNVAFAESIDIEKGAETISNTFTVPVVGGVDKAVYALTRPIRRTAYDAMVSVSHSDASDCTVDSIYVRTKTQRRQAEKQSGSTQG